MSFNNERFTKASHKVISYGTAGFRLKAVDLPWIMYRLGIVAGLRSKHKQAQIGVMVTASHNPVEDNGAKVIDPMGEMLEMAWEGYATDIVNASDEELAGVVDKVAQNCSIDMNSKGKVLVARDTRPSGQSLCEACFEGLKAITCDYEDFGVLTTPQLHYIVCARNSGGTFGEPSEEGYYKKLAHSFKEFAGLFSTESSGDGKRRVVVDGANGVGALKLKLLGNYIDAALLEIEVVNDGSTGILNENCGADYVKSNQRAPQGVTLNPGTPYASFDGDADRIVFYFTGPGDTFHLLDGDRIACLVAGYLKELLVAAGLDLKVGVVQTAYANGSSTQYLTEKMGVDVACAKTGVKHLHHLALQYDVAAYFEANGHGTVLFSKTAEAEIAKVKSAANGGSKREAAVKLDLLTRLINQTVGDAISDLLLVESIRLAKGLSVNQWLAQYSDLPNVLRKVKVSDRNAIQTTDAERKTTAPPGLQEAIDVIVTEYSQGRSFVRPSGTEDVVRIYAEASSKESAVELALRVANITYDVAGGVGDRPS